MCRGAHGPAHRSQETVSLVEAHHDVGLFAQPGDQATVRLLSGEETGRVTSPIRVVSDHVAAVGRTHLVDGRTDTNTEDVMRLCHRYTRLAATEPGLRARSRGGSHLWNLDVLDGYKHRPASGQASNRPPHLGCNVRQG